MPRHDIFKEEEIAKMLDGWGDSSEDEFPDVDVVVRQYRHKVQEKQEGESRRGDKGNAPPTKGKLVSQTEHDVKKGPAVKATPLRRRKLGPSQTVDGSLLKRWDSTTIIKEKDSEVPKPRNSRMRVREASTETSASSRGTSELTPAQARKAGSASKDVKPPSREKNNQKSNEKGKAGNVKGTHISKQTTRNPIPSDGSSEESDILKETLELSEEEVSEFVSLSESESESESDAWNSDSEPSFPHPVRRSKSPTIEWAKPQRTLFQAPRKKPASSNKQPQTTISDSSKRPSKQRGQGNSGDSLEASQPGNLEDAFQKLKIFNEDSEPDERSIKAGKKPILEPTTPKKTLKTIPASPLKTPKIPMSPWKPEHKEFWEPGLHFAWIDEHSPEKKLADSPKKTKQQSAQDLKAEAKRKYGTSPEKRDARKAFDAAKEGLARDFLAELDARITDGKLGQLTKDTGGLCITWSKTLQTTAGRAHWKCKTLSHTTKHADGTTISKREERQHHASIELACKVLSNEADLLNTVAHEFCHLAVFMLNGKPKTAHGPEFKAWGQRCGRVFADRGIVVTTKHNYAIDYKYIWKCADCTCEVKRHSKSVDPVRQRCGRCRGMLIQVKPTPRGGSASASASASATATPGNGEGGGGGKEGPATTARKKSAWNEFMSEEMRALAQNKPGMPFKDRMAVVSAKWAELQRSQKEAQQKREGKREQTMKELGTAVEVLQIDDDEYAEDEEVVRAAAREAVAYDIFS